MVRGANPPKRQPAAYRLAVWMLPPHRKEWGEAMLNETAWIESRRAALQGVLGCTAGLPAGKGSPTNWGEHS